MKCIWWLGVKRSAVTISMPVPVLFIVLQTRRAGRPSRFGTGRLAPLDVVVFAMNFSPVRKRLFLRHDAISMPVHKARSISCRFISPNLTALGPSPHLAPL